MKSKRIQKNKHEKNMFFFAPMRLNKKEENMCAARKSMFLGFVLLISILSFNSFVLSETTRIKGDIAGVDLANQTMLLSTSEGFVQLNLAGSVLKRNGIGILPEEFQPGERISALYDPSTMNAVEVNTKGGYLEGFITAITVFQNGNYDLTITSPSKKPVTIQVNQKTTMKKNGIPIRVFNYEVGEYAKVVYIPKPMVALSLEAWDSRIVDAAATKVKGYLVKIEHLSEQKTQLGRITISTSAGELFLTNVTTATRIELNGIPCKFNDLIVGDFLVVVVKPSGYATSIIATRKDEDLDVCTGYIISIKVKGDFVPSFEITMQTNEYRRPLIFNMSIGAEVWKDGKRVKPFELKAGDFATVVYDKNKMMILKIEAWTVTK